MRKDSSGILWFVMTMLTMVFIALVAAEKTAAGHGDADDAASWQASTSSHDTSAVTAQSVVRRFGLIGTKLLERAWSSLDADLVQVLQLDFEMRLCELHASSFAERESSIDEIAELVEAPQQILTSEVSSETEVALTPKTSPDSTYRFTRDDLLRPFEFPGGSFVSKLNMEEYRPYDFFDSTMMASSPTVDVVNEGSLEAEDVMTKDELISAACDRDSSDRDSSDEAEKVAGHSPLTADSAGESVGTSDNSWVSWGYAFPDRMRVNVAALNARILVHLVCKYEAVHSTVYRLALLSPADYPAISRYDVFSLGVAVAKHWIEANAIDTSISEPNNPIAEEQNQRAQLRSVFGSSVLADPLELIANHAPVRPPTLATPVPNDESVQVMNDSPVESDVQSLENSWGVFVYLQGGSWEHVELLGDKPTDDSSLINPTSIDQDAKSASLTENPGHGASQR